MKPPSRAAAIEAVKGRFIRKELTNQETGISGTVTGGSLNKMKHESAWKKSNSIMAHYHALGNLDTLFESATKTYHRAGHKEEDAANLAAVHIFTHAHALQRAGSERGNDGEGVSQAPRIWDQPAIYV
ncbi:MAG: hypothetical protein H0X43_12975 [Nitrosospira sp.]|nr:hypothetical protein [Nitrosospira sp.]